MIDAKQATEAAKASAAGVLGPRVFHLEEFDRIAYQDREVWDITLSYLPDPDPESPTFQLFRPSLVYKRFLIDAETGQLLAMKLREVATQ